MTGGTPFSAIKNIRKGTLAPAPGVVYYVTTHHDTGDSGPLSYTSLTPDGTMDDEKKSTKLSAEDEEWERFRRLSAVMNMAALLANPNVTPNSKDLSIDRLQTLSLMAWDATDEVLPPLDELEY